MKTIMDLIKIVEAEIKYIKHVEGGAEYFINLPIGLGILIRSDHYIKAGKLLFSVIEFNQLVSELSSANWIKGASLEEYKSADKEILSIA